MIRHNGIEIDCVRMVFRNGEHQFRLSPNARKRQFPALCHLILGGGLTLEQMFHNIYGHRADGGPISGIGGLRVWLCQWKRIFNALNMELRRERRGNESYYQLVPKDVV